MWWLGATDSHVGNRIFDTPTVIRWRPASVSAGLIGQTVWTNGYADLLTLKRRAASMHGRLIAPDQTSGRQYAWW